LNPLEKTADTLRRERVVVSLGSYEETYRIVGNLVDSLSACVDARPGPRRRCRVRCSWALFRALRSYGETAASSWLGAARFAGTPLCRRLGGAASPYRAWHGVSYRHGQSISGFTAQGKQSRVRLDRDGRSEVHSIDLPSVWKPCLLVAGAAYNAMAVKPFERVEG
jgi:hypothetical protein